MKTTEIFSMSEIPYSILARFGLTKEMINDFPEPIRKQLLSGMATPVLPIVVSDNNGNKLKSAACICLVREGNGSVDVRFISCLRDKDLSDYSEEQQKRLVQGDVIIALLRGQGLNYIQYNDSIRQTMTVPVKMLAHNIEIVAKEIPLNKAEEEILSLGSIVEKEDFSIGIDLNSPTGCRIYSGNAQQWKEEGKTNNLSKYNFGTYGCWVNDPVTHWLNYIPVDDYTEEMRAECRHKIKQ